MSQPPPPPPAAPPPPPAGTAATGQVGKIRVPLTVVLLALVTLGIYLLYWYYKTYQEMKDYSGQGLGGLVGLLFAFLCNIINWFVLPSEVSNLYVRDGKQSPISPVVGLWWLLPIVGAFIWLWKVQSALNDFWESKGATA